MDVKKLRILGRIMHNTGADTIIAGFLGFVLLCGLLIWVREPEINHFGEALWYCFATVSTIGFGDVVVHTMLSRVLTVLLSVYAVATIAIFTAVVVNYFQQVTARGYREGLEAFLEKAERLPELSQEELEEMASQARKWR